MHQIHPCFSPPEVDDLDEPFFQGVDELGALPVAAAEGGALQLLVGDLGAEAVGHEGVAAAGVDHEAGPHLDLLAVGAGGEHGGAVVVEVDVGDLGLVVDGGAQRDRVLEQLVVELRADHLEGQRALVLDVVPEAPRGVGDPVDVDEANAGLADPPRLHVLEHAQLLEDVVAEREHRLTDVLAREPVTLEDGDRMSLLGEERRHRRARRATADHHDVGGGYVCHLAPQGCVRVQSTAGGAPPPPASEPRRLTPHAHEPTDPFPANPRAGRRPV